MDIKQRITNIHNYAKEEKTMIKNWKKPTIFISGILMGTAGIKILTSKDAKNVYAHTTAAVLRAKECVMSVVTKVQENAGDILAQAKDINETKYVDEVIDDEETEEAEAETEETAEEEK